MGKAIIYLSLGTKRVASWHWLHEVVLERQEEIVYPKDHHTSAKLLLVSFTYSKS